MTSLISSARSLLKSAPRCYSWGSLFTRCASQQSSNASYIESLSGSTSEVIMDHSRPDGIVVLALNRPAAKNSLGKNLVAGLHDAIASLEKDSSARAVVVCSLVRGVFCAGADLKERIHIPVEDVGRWVSYASFLLQRLARLPPPTICALDGVAMGGGMEIALACDLRFASTDARMGVVETKLGIIPGAGGTQRLPRLIGLGLAKELLMTGRVVGGSDAARLGLVNRCVAQNDAGNAALLQAFEVAEEIAGNGPLAVRLVKTAVDRGMETTLENGLRLEEEYYSKTIPSKDRLEGLAAFKEKRKPQYTGA